MTKKTKEMIVYPGWVFVTGMVSALTPFGPWLYSQNPLVVYVIWPFVVVGLAWLTMRLLPGKPGQT